MTDRAALYIDGSNLYHTLRHTGALDGGSLDYAALSATLVGPRRTWVATHYYVGALSQQHDPDAYAAQRRFLSLLARSDPRITVHLGRIERRVRANPAAAALAQVLARHGATLDPGVAAELEAIVTRHHAVRLPVEKAVDVALAVDLVRDAHTNAYDTAILVSGDGDFTPAVAAVQALGKTVVVASPVLGHELSAIVQHARRLTPELLAGCRLPGTPARTTARPARAPQGMARTWA